MTAPRHLSSAAVIALGASIASVAISGVAYAYYSAGASGHKDAAAGVDTAQPITFSVTGQSSALLYPGAAGDVNISLTNPYARTITVTGLTGSVSTSHAGCTNSDFTIAPSPSGLPASLTANQTATATLTGAVTMKTGAADACRGAAITATLSVTGRL
jgi:hypothetical protein